MIFFIFPLIFRCLCASINDSDGYIHLEKIVKGAKARQIMNGALFDLKKAPAKKAVCFLTFQVNKIKKAGAL